MEKRIQSFEARNAAGESVTLHVWQKFVEHRDRSGTRRTPGLKRITTAGGDSVNIQDDGSYLVVQTDEVLTSDDPSAPQGGS